MKFTSIFLVAVLLCITVCNAAEKAKGNSCFNPGIPAKTAEIQKILDNALKENYQMTLMARDMKNSKSSKVVEVKQDKKLGQVRWTPNGADKLDRQQWISNDTGLQLYIGADSKCNVTQWANLTNYPLNPPNLKEIQDAVGNDKAKQWTDVKDLITFARELEGKIWLEPKERNKSLHIRGVDINEWVTCKNVSASTYMEIRIWISQDAVKIMDQSISNLPLQIQVAIFSGTQEKIEDLYRYQYDIFDIKSKPCNASLETYLLPPPGVVCSNQTNAKKLPAVADSFSMRLQYLDNTGMRLDSTEINYCKNDSLFGFTYKESDKDEPFSSNLGLKEEQNVVHDFKTGLQYASSIDYRTCALSKIALNASDAKPGSGNESMNRKITLKSPFELLFLKNESNYVYVGQRWSDTGVLCDVWIMNDTVKGVGYSREAWFTSDQWKLDAYKDKKIRAVPYQLVTYKKALTEIKKESTQRFVFSENYGNAELFPIDTWPLKACMNMTNSSYLTVNAQIDTEDTKDSAMKIKLHRLLAKVMNISVLRISRIGAHTDFSAPDAGSIFMLQIAEENEIAGTPTVDMIPKVNLTAAIKALNDTLNKGDLVIEKKAKLNKGSLVYMSDQFRPGPFGPIVNKQVGYTGGSMAVLAFFMLFLGGVAGVGGAYFMWKRNRGIAYQVYE